MSNKPMSTDHAVIEIGEYNKLRDFYKNIKEGDHARFVNSRHQTNYIYGNTDEISEEILKGNEELEKKVSKYKQRKSELYHEKRDIESDLRKELKRVEELEDKLHISNGKNEKFFQMIWVLLALLCAAILFIVV